MITDIEKVIGLLVPEFKKEEIDFAVIGGLALILAGAERMTQDVDFMVLLVNSEKLDGIMKKFGYTPLQRTENVANYSGLGPLGQVDFLFAHRKYGLRMLEKAVPQILFGQNVRVARPEDLIGLKIQAVANDPKRTDQDMLDIKNILRSKQGKLDMGLIREYFKLFKKENELDGILSEL